ncbi:glycoside hydrolase family 2 protein [Paenibacillus aquistagni]|uniref:glycoside hydrolase family 2 protein n=1 Tax=Paenibacillus aquistagni TaxID=1852522 RepID=UPI00145AD996|nr:sugar-binding domain-containing protein [Paenibacillus aquistagni]NMM55014.1 beta-galactosidase [Paenibacillus aquistagni]
MSYIPHLPRPEYPRPQLVRERWMNLNGEWQFEFDHGQSGRERELYKADSLSQRIVVPFCPESKLSGIGYKDFMNAVWYRRTFDLPKDWQGQVIKLHFGAVDYKAEVWINGVSVGTHRGGYTPFSFDITMQLLPGTNVITLAAEDATRSGLQPRGKQSGSYYSKGCDYTRTTGIWQTVWLEAVPKAHITQVKMTPDAVNGAVAFQVHSIGASQGARLTIDTSYAGAPTGSAELLLNGGNGETTIVLSEKHLWGVGQGNLYDVKLTLSDGEAQDTVTSYFGLRTVALEGMAILLNGEPVFQRLVLDQGFYPEGVYTAPTDEDLKRDIEISMGLGFNGARLHEKIFEPRFLYWADRMGYLVWGEHANWGLNLSRAHALEVFIPEWMEAIERDYNHPSIVGWCPFNETWDCNGSVQNNEVLRIIYRLTKSLDTSRPVIDTSGNYHVETDIYDIHDYEQDPEAFASHHEAFKNDGQPYDNHSHRQAYGGQPYFVSEYGGIWWSPGSDGWGYGERPKTEEEFLERYERLTRTLLDNPNICAFCYTQLYDVEQEVNGLYSYERQAKFDPELIRRVNQMPAAIEKKDLEKQ